MDDERARALIANERRRVEELLAGTQSAAGQDRGTENEEIYVSDAAQPLSAQWLDDAIAAKMLRRLDALDRALRRVNEGTFGRSVKSGVRIPELRLEADPAAELTFAEEAELRRPRSI